MSIKERSFAQHNGKNVRAYTLENSHRVQMTCLNYGCIITELRTPDRNGNYENIVLGFNSLDEYFDYSSYFGAIVGRVAGRIKEGRFELDGRSYQLARNDGNNHLHGGTKGFSDLIWDAEIIDRQSIKFTYVSADGDEGYPGKLLVSVTYSLTDENELLVSYEATTDQDTLVNLTNHTYFNLSGDLKRDITEHTLKMKSDKFLELSEDLLPTGKEVDVDGTPFDFRSGRRISTGISSAHTQNVLAGHGYDHPFLLKENRQAEVVLSDDISGRGS